MIHIRSSQTIDIIGSKGYAVLSIAVKNPDSVNIRNSQGALLAELDRSDIEDLHYTLVCFLNSGEFDRDN